MRSRAQKPAPAPEPENASEDLFVVLPPDELEELLKVDAEAEEEDRRGECIPADELIARLRQRLALAR
jgi:hypothetical protein